MSRRSSSRASPGAGAGRQKSPGEDKASTATVKALRLQSLFRDLGDGNFKVCEINLDRENNSIFLNVVQGQKGGDKNRIAIRLSIAEALEMAFNLQLAAEILQKHVLGVEK